MHTRVQQIGIAFVVMSVVGIAAPKIAWGSEEPRPTQFISTSGVAVVTGDYGTGQDTTVTQLNQAFKVRGQIGEIGLSVPYLFRSGGGVTAGETSRVRTIPKDASGFGDLRLKGAYYWIEETDSHPSVDLTAQLKFPTASKDKGLGTGRFDGGVGAELLKKFGSWITFLDGGILLRDKPSGSSIQSTRFDYSVGVGYPFTSQFTAYASLDGSTQSSSGTDAPLELVFSGVYKATQNWSVSGFLLVGLTDGSPDVGGGTSATLRF